MITPVKRIRGVIEVPGDKSITHRAVMIGSISNGKTTVYKFLRGADCMSTVSVYRELGVTIEELGDHLIIHGKGMNGLTEPLRPLDVGNSGTTIRLVMGILAAQPFLSVLIGDDSIGRRPMRRVVDPLRQMGARILGRAGGQYTPIVVEGSALQGIQYRLPVASAQVKSAILLAGLYAEGTTTVFEPAPTRDHTERMLSYFGAELIQDLGGVSIRGGQTLTGQDIVVPGDISSAAFFLSLAAVHPDAELLIRGVNINPTRTGIIDVLRQMGASIEIENQRSEGGEPVADLYVTGGELTGITIEGEMIPRLIDEIPVLAAIATQAHGRTVIRNAEELKVKESNRIDAMVTQLKLMGAKIEATSDGMVIEGPTPLKGAEVEVYGDHRIAMSLSVAAALAQRGEETRIRDAGCVSVSFPNFYQLLEEISHN
jgi:3-phosphoshikimate 1-carboxyvinyltransferase